MNTKRFTVDNDGMKIQGILALVSAVYKRFLDIKSLGPYRIGIITAGYSLPCDLCIVIAYASSSSSRSENG